MRWSGAGRRPSAAWALAGPAAALLLFCALAAQLDTRALDLEVYREAAARVFVEAGDPYPRRPDQQLPFTYPPTALFLLRPLAGLDAAQAARLLWLLNLALALVLLVLLPRDLAQADPAQGNPAQGNPARADGATAGRRLRVVGPLYVAGFGGLYLTLHFHQINLLLLLALWLYWRVLRRGAGGAAAGYGAGMALALGSVAKPHVGLLGLAALPRAGPRQAPLRWRILLGAVLGGAALLLLSLHLAPAGSWGSWLALVPGSTSLTELPPGHSSIAAPWNRAIAGQVARLLVPNKFTRPLLESPALAGLLSAALVLLLALVTMRLLWRCRRAGLVDPTAVDLQLSLLSVAVFLAAPASWTHHLVLLLPAALVLLRDAVLDPAEPAASRCTAALVLAVLALTLDDLIPREVRTASQPLMALMTTAVVALWLLLAQRLGRRIQHQVGSRDAVSSTARPHTPNPLS